MDRVFQIELGKLEKTFEHSIFDRDLDFCMWMAENPKSLQSQSEVILQCENIPERFDPCSIQLNNIEEADSKWEEGDMEFPEENPSLL